MARKSRKLTLAAPARVEDRPCCAALYIRLSVEDKHTGSISIETQKMILDSFLEREADILAYDTYIDGPVIIGLNQANPCGTRVALV